MLFYFLYPLSETWAVFNVFRYLTFRSFGAGITAVLLCMLLGPLYIRFLKSRQIGQEVRNDGPQSHLSKKGTPTMGGGLILFSILVSTLLWADLSNRYVWIVILTTLAFGWIGSIDDWSKLRKRQSKGLSAKQKLLFQSFVGLIAAGILYQTRVIPPLLVFPFLKSFSIDLGWFYVVFGALVIVGASNAVNLTDGLDGLAVGPIMTTGATFVILAYCAGHRIIAEYLQIPYVPGVGEVAVIAASLAAASLGFLWFNTYPAQIFMGDTGSLALGASIGTIALVTHNEILLAICGGIFVLEAVSVMIQVASFKMTGKRVFRMAPIHHHFELKGWAEPKVIVRFWIISILLALVSLASLKLR